jgi:hypothetical protein
VVVHHIAVSLSVPEIVHQNVQPLSSSFNSRVGLNSHHQVLGIKSQVFEEGGQLSTLSSVEVDILVESDLLGRRKIPNP